MRLYLRSRHVLAVAVLIVALAAASVAVGGRLLTVWSSHEPLMMPYRYVLSLVAAAAAVASLESPMPQADGADTGPLRRAWTTHLWALLALAALANAVAEVFTVQGSPAQAVRATVCWYGLALVSTAVVRAAFAWVVPVAALFPLVWWGAVDGGTASWNWATAPAGEALAWVVAVGSLAVGALAAHLRR